MKSILTYIGLLAILLSGCTTGSYVTSSYSDDIYFNPGDVPPPIAVKEKPAAKESPEKSGDKLIISKIEKNEDGSNTMNNYIFKGTESDADALRYNMEQVEPESSDTTIYYNDDEMQYVINNYFSGDDLDYAYRIRRFHNPYFYDPFYWDYWCYDPYYSWSFGWGYPGWSFSWNWGWGYPGYGWGWYDPWYGWGYPGYGWGYPGYGWGYPGYGWGYPPYYPGYPSHPIYPGGGGNWDYGKRRSTNTSIARDTRRNTGAVASVGSGRNKSSSIGNISNGAVNESSRRTTSVSGARGTSDRMASNINSKSAENGKVLTEMRRSTSNSSTRPSVNGQNEKTIRTQSYTRPGTITQNRSYTRPSSSSNSAIRNNYTRPRVVTKSSSVSTSGYSQPKTTSSYNRSYRASSTYSKTTSSGSSSRSYRAPSSSVRSYSPGNYRSSSSSGSSYRSSGSVGRSSGSSYSGGGSRSVGSGGGGGRSSGGGSSHSGRR